MAIDRNARTRASNRYNAKHYERINIVVAKGERDKIKLRAASKNKSLNAYITDLIYRDMKEGK